MVAFSVGPGGIRCDQQADAAKALMAFHAEDHGLIERADALVEFASRGADFLALLLFRALMDEPVGLDCGF
jgi:hypothetical protein